MATTSIVKIGIVINTDKHEYTVFEGDVLNDMIYRDGDTTKMISGSVRVINAATKANTQAVNSCPPQPYIHKYITPQSLIIDTSNIYDAELTSIPIANIIEIGSIVSSMTTVDNVIAVEEGAASTLNDVIASADTGTIISLSDGEYASELNIGNSVTLMGADTNAYITGKINISGATTLSARGADAEEGGIDVTLDNLHLTEDATIEVLTGVKSFTMKNCTFEGHNLTDTKAMPIQLKGEESMLVTIENNYFGAESTNSYNLIECYPKLISGSSISGNRFDFDCCRHNQVSLYNVEDNAVVYIDKNSCAESKNMLRIGFKGDPKAFVSMNGNSYDTTDENDPEQAGLFLVQPYATLTSSFNDVKILVNNTKMPDKNGQLFFIYIGASDTVITKEKFPKVYVDGKLCTDITIVNRATTV